MTATDELGADYWTWRARQQPRSHDDIPRITRPSGWTADWSTAAVARYRSELAGFEHRWTALPPTDDRAELVDRRLLGAAFARVHWELDVVRIWQTQPRFYVDQTIGCVFDLLLAPDPDAVRLQDVVAVLAATPQILADGRSNLAGQQTAEFADATIAELSDIQAQIGAMLAALSELSEAKHLSADLTAAGDASGTALAAFRQWLLDERGSMSRATPVGAVHYQWFLTEVALMPFTPAEILAIGRSELDRAITLETLERNRNAHGTARPAPERPADAEQQSAAEAVAELQVRQFYIEQGLLGQPDSLRHYLNAPLPDYLASIRWLGVTDDLTDQERVDDDGVSYVPSFPTDEMPYFYAANADDPRAGIVHEGAHYQQLALSWQHPREIRRHYYDSGSNEGIAFYNEEMMLASGLFEDSGGTREIMYNFMRLRALRVEVDVGLALGELNIERAAAYLAQVVPMDPETAREEAIFFAACPGQAMTYQIGKTQILRFFADTARRDGDSFDLQSFHDRLWLEGNVPIALQRWEFLDDESDLTRLDQLRTHCARAEQGPGFETGAAPVSSESEVAAQQ